MAPRNTTVPGTKEPQAEVPRGPWRLRTAYGSLSVLRTYVPVLCRVENQGVNDVLHS